MHAKVALTPRKLATHVCECKAASWFLAILTESALGQQLPCSKMYCYTQAWGYSSNKQQSLQTRMQIIAVQTSETTL